MKTGPAVCILYRIQAGWEVLAVLASRKPHYIAWIDRLIPIADEHGTDSPEWQAEVEATVPKLHDPKVAREAAAMIADVFNRWKSKLPPKTNPK